MDLNTQEFKEKIINDFNILRGEFEIDVKVKETLIATLRSDLDSVSNEVAQLKVSLQKEECKVTTALKEIEDLRVALNDERSRTTALSIEVTDLQVAVESINSGCATTV